MSIETGSSLQTFMTCPRLYEYKYRKLLDSRGYSSALGLGSMVHARVENWTGKGREFASLGEAVAISRWLDSEQVKAFELDDRKSLGMFKAWEKRWGGTEHPFGNDKWEWLESEKEFLFPINADGDMHAGKIDGIIRHKEWDKVFVYELKTATSREKDTYFHRLGVDRQVFANIYAAQEMGFHVDGILYDVMWKPSIRARKEETPEQLAERFVATINEDLNEHFHREVTYRKAADIQDHLYDVQAQFAAIDQASTQRRFYRNSGSCEKFGKLCSFFSICQEGGTDMETAYRKRDRKHPELSLDVQKEIP